MKYLILTLFLIGCASKQKINTIDEMNKSNTFSDNTVECVIYVKTLQHTMELLNEYAKNDYGVRDLCLAFIVREK